jgi:hypothetical protein
MEITNKIPIFDINIAAFLKMKGHTPEFTKNGTRVVFEFAATQEIYDDMRDYQTNATVPVIDFVTALRFLRSKMYQEREEKEPT